MIFTYKEACLFLEARKKAGIVYSLDRIEALMKKLNHPEKKLRAIHVAGTNGKGSVCAYISSVLQKANYRTGAFNTPVFGDIKDQLSIDGIALTEQEFTEACSAIKPAIAAVENERGELVSEFECMTAMAINYFSNTAEVDIAVIETGMGGRLDATNVLPNPLAAVITNVSNDHQAFLGSTTENIAREKAGIIKPGIPVFTATDGEALKVIKETAARKKTELTVLAECVNVTIEGGNCQTASFIYESSRRKEKHRYELQLFGRHQIENASLAVTVLDYLNEKGDLVISNEAIKAGLWDTLLPGRWENVSETPCIVLDTAHNNEAVKAVCQSIDTCFSDKRVSVLFASMKDKDVLSMVRRLSTVNSRLYVSSFSSPRSMTAADYHLMSDKIDLHFTIVSDWQVWLEEWEDQAEASDVLLITGSHQFVGECRSNLV